MPCAERGKHAIETISGLNRFNNLFETFCLDLTQYSDYEIARTLV
jgi:hypothetical protein